jgi:chromate transport protein ChrA
MMSRDKSEIEEPRRKQKKGHEENQEHDMKKNIAIERDQIDIDYHHVRWGSFLKDVLICSLGAYGGPEAHYGVFTDQMVIKKKYLSEEELVELIALTGVLPGPSSTQTIVAIGYKAGGPVLAFLTFLVWALPVLAVMILLSFLSQLVGGLNVSQDSLRFIGPMAVGFIVVAAVVPDDQVVEAVVGSDVMAGQVFSSVVASIAAVEEGCPVDSDGSGSDGDRTGTAVLVWRSAPAADGGIVCVVL